MRLTAPNPGLMTGPGTNSYLIGNPGSGYVVVDPGPDLPHHLQQLFDLTADTDGLPGAIHAIVCTHSHADHAPGAWPLKTLCQTAGRPAPPVIGLPSAATARPNSHFVPDRPVQHRQPLPLGDAWPTGLPAIHALHTPGHAANHVCLWLPERAALLTGDHILHGSSTVIDPPDGNMRDYFASLDLLETLCQTESVRRILPAHGAVIPQPLDAIHALIKHRRAREARVRAALAALPDGTPDQWLPLAYADVSPALWPVAMRSLLAHVEHLRNGIEL